MQDGFILQLPDGHRSFAFYPRTGIERIYRGRESVMARLDFRRIASAPLTYFFSETGHSQAPIHF